LRRQRNSVFAWQIDIDKDRIRSQLRAKTLARLPLCGRTDHLYLTGVAQQFRQVPAGQRFVFDNYGANPDPDENRS
jgi:hypothetical protein